MGQCFGLYAKSVIDLSMLFVKYGIPIQHYFLFNESLITRARNYAVDEFLRSDATHMLFIDSDVSFNAQDVIAMMALQTDESEYDVLAAPYPKKCITWEKIVAAVNKGVADEDPNVLEHFVGDFVFNFAVTADGPKEVRLDEPAEVLETGTGFMMIRRSAFDKYKEAYPQYAYRPDHVRTANFDGSREIHAYFDCIIDPETKRYLSEDYFFCQNLRKAGGKVWLCPWMHLTHSGFHVFGGSLPAIASIGESVTADVNKLKKVKK